MSADHDEPLNIAPNKPSVCDPESMITDSDRTPQAGRPAGSALTVR